MLKTRTRKRKLATRVIAAVLALGIAIPTGINTYIAKAAGEVGIPLNLSTTEVNDTIQRVAGETALSEMQTLKDDSVIPAWISNATPPVTEVTVQPEQDVIVTDQNGETISEEILEEQLPVLSEGYYNLDQELENFLSELQLPEDSQTVKHDLLGALEGLWFIKGYTGEGYTALAMLNPDSMNVELFILNNSAQEQFSLRVVDANGKAVKVVQENAVVEQVSYQTLTHDTLDMYQQQPNIQVEVRQAIAQTTDVTVSTEEPSSSSSEVEASSAPDSSEVSSVAPEVEESSSSVTEEVSQPVDTSEEVSTEQEQEVSQPVVKEPTSFLSDTDTKEESAVAQEVSTEEVTESVAEAVSSQETTTEEVSSEDSSSSVVAEQAETTEVADEASSVSQDSSEVEVSEESSQAEESQVADEEVSQDSSPVVEDQTTKSGQLTEVEAVVVESSSVQTSSDAKKDVVVEVPENALYRGSFSGITPFGLNYTVEYYIGDTLYGNVLTVGDGEYITEEPTPPAGSWPANTTAFNGWFEQDATQAFDFTQPVTSNIRLYARFSNAYTITFKNQDNQVLETKQVAPGNPIPETNMAVTPPVGQHLTHWYLEGSSDPANDKFVFGTTATKDITLCPYFSNQFYVVFMSQGTQVDPQTVVENAKITQPVAPTRPGYAFSHWSTTESGAAYDFNTPVTENVILYAVWTPQTVNYKVAIWVEKENITGDPGNDRSNYVYVTGVNQSGLSGSSTTVTAAQIQSYVDSFTATNTVSPLKYSNFSHSDTATLSGNGTTVINVYYKRIVYTYNFDALDYYKGTDADPTYIVSNGVKTPSVVGSTADLTLYLKYQQDISAVWPSVEKSSTVPYSFGGWQAPVNLEDYGSIYVTKRYSLTTDMISTSSPKTELTYYFPAYWQNTTAFYDVEYWLETYDGSGTNWTDKGGTTRNYSQKAEYAQRIYGTGTLNPKNLEGFLSPLNDANRRVVTYPSTGGTLYQFYYIRNQNQISFDSQGGSAVPTVSGVYYEAPVKAYKPADPTRNGYIFKGWYTDNEFKELFDFDTATMPFNNVELYARWESSALTVTYYDRLGAGNVLKTQGYDLGDYVTFPDDLYQVGDFVPGYGMFLGWNWIVPGTNIFTEYSLEIPVQRDISLYATWKTTGFTVMYEAGAGTGTPPTDTEVYDIGSTVALKAPDTLIPPTNEVFFGWQIKGSGDTQLYYPRNIFSILGDTVFEAQFGNPDSAYTVTFEPGFDGSTDVAQKWYVPKTTGVYLLDDVFTRPHATMVGWSETKDASTVQYDLGELITPTKNMVLYPVWSFNRYRVVFQSDPDKGMLLDGASSTDRIEYDDILANTVWSTAITKGTPVPVANPGYVFTGWSPAIPAATSPISADATYVAQFEKQTPIQVIADSASKEYDGTALSKSTAVVSGLDSTLYKVEYTLKASGTITNVGSVANEVDTVKVIRLSDNADMTAYFDIVKTPGTLTVTKRNITVKAEDANSPYTGSLVSVTVGGILVSGSLPTGQTMNAVGTGSGTNVGAYPITLGSVTILQGSTDVSSNYQITTQQGSLTIGKRTGNMSAIANDVNVVYDGNAHQITVQVSGVSSYTVEYATSAAGPYSATQPSLVNVADSKTVYYRVSSPSDADVEGSAQVTITPAPVSVKANNKSKEYGSSDPAFDATVLGKPANGVAVNYTLSRDSGESIGNYAIHVSAGSNPNYTVTVEAGNLEITKRTGVMSASSQNVSVVYDGLSHGITVSVSGVSSGYEVLYSESAAGPFTATQPVIVNVADSKTVYYQVNHPTEATVTGSANVTITKREVTLTADNKTKQFGDADPAFSATSNNVPLTGDALVYTLSREAGENIGDYDINISLGSNPNYNITTNKGVLSIVQRSGLMTASASDVNVVYDGNNHSISVVVSGVTSGYTVEYSTSAAGPFTTTNPSYKNVTSSAVTVYYKVTHPTEATVTGSATINITPRDVVVTADNKTKTYGDTDPTLTATVTNGTVAGDAINYTLSREAGENVADYDITVALGSNPNYNVTTVKGTFSIVKRSGVMTASAADVNVVYDGNTHSINVVVSGVSSGYTITYGTNPAGPFSATQPVIKNVADSKVVYYQVSHNNEATVTGSAMVSITPCAVTVSANNNRKDYGAIDPILTATVSGKPANGDNVNYTLSRNPGEEIGDYAITVALGSNPNYTVTTAGGTFTISKRSGVMQATAADVTVVYDGEAHGITVTVSGASGAVVEYATSASGPYSAVQPVNVNVADSKTVYYRVTHPTEAEVTGSAQVTINKCDVTVTANPATKSFSMIDPPFTATVTGKPAAGDSLNYSLVRDPGETMGSYPIKVILGNNPNYNVTTANSTLTISKLTIEIRLPIGKQLQLNEVNGYDYYGNATFIPAVSDTVKAEVKPYVNITVPNILYPGTYVIKGTVVGAPSNYTIQVVNGTVSVIPNSGNSYVW